jgi:fatty acid synthase subunit beta
VKPDGTVVDEPILEELTPESTSYTFRSSSGLIFATQFAQLAIVILEKAAFEDMRAHGLVPENCQFAGHSLGEYGAMAAMGDIMPIEQLLFAVFYRGLTMQTTVERDAQGRTEYSLFAVNPSRLSSGNLSFPIIFSIRLTFPRL